LSLGQSGAIGACRRSRSARDALGAEFPQTRARKRRGRPRPQIIEDRECRTQGRHIAPFRARPSGLVRATQVVPRGRGPCPITTNLPGKRLSDVRWWTRDLTTLPAPVGELAGIPALAMVGREGIGEARLGSSTG